MESDNNLFVVFFFLILLILYYMFVYQNNMVYMKSSIDNNDYLVRDVPDKKNAANMLAQLRQNVLRLSTHMYNSRTRTDYKSYQQYIEILNDRVRNIKFIESSPDSLYTSYSVNKGEKIVFCMRSQKTGKLHNINLMMYVALHEISHVACPIYDNHGNLFKKIFAFFIDVANEIGIYDKINFEQTPVEYCGLMI